MPVQWVYFLHSLYTPIFSTNVSLLTSRYLSTFTMQQYLLLIDNYEAEEIFRREISAPPFCGKCFKSHLAPSIPLRSLRGWEAVPSWTWDTMSSFPASQAGSGIAIPVAGSFRMPPCQDHSSCHRWALANQGYQAGTWTDPPANSCGVRELGETAKGGK